MRSLARARTCPLKASSEDAWPNIGDCSSYSEAAAGCAAEAGCCCHARHPRGHRMARSGGGGGGASVCGVGARAPPPRGRWASCLCVRRVLSLCRATERAPGSAPAVASRSPAHSPCVRWPSLSRRACVRACVRACAHLRGGERRAERERAQPGSPSAKPRLAARGGAAQRRGAARGRRGAHRERRHRRTRREAGRGGGTRAVRRRRTRVMRALTSNTSRVQRSSRSRLQRDTRARLRRRAYLLVWAAQLNTLRRVVIWLDR